MDSVDARRAARLDRADEARRAVAGASDAELVGLLADAQTGWGRSRRVHAVGHELFVKAVPVTDLELEHGLGTANVYGIPPYLNYPFGSPGLGAGRELAFARRSTMWVESGACSGFPMLLHDRVIERPIQAGTELALGEHSAYRGDEPAMNRYLADRASAHAELLLVYEDIGCNAVDWLLEHPTHAQSIVDDVRSTIGFMQRHDVVHFDVDLFNVVTDGTHAYVADHGLVLDASFALTDAERGFLAANRHFDEGNLIMSVGHQLYWTYRRQPVDQRKRIDDRLGLTGASFVTAARRLVDAIDDLDDAGLGADAALTDLIRRHRAVILDMHDFYACTRSNWTPDTILDDQRLASLLRTS